MDLAAQNLKSKGILRTYLIFSLTLQVKTGC